MHSISGFSDFTSDLYTQCVHSANENVILSPVSILNVLALLSTAANGATYEQMIQGLYLTDNKTFTANQFHEINKSLGKDNKEITLSFASEIYVHENCTLNATFQRAAAERFSCGVGSLNFDNNIQAARAINDVIAEKTSKKIEKFIQPHNITNDAAAAMLTNAIYFKGNWENKFNKSRTAPGDFYINENETVRVDFMKRWRYFNFDYVPKLKASALEIEYAQNSNYSLIVLLPWRRTGLSALEDELQKRKNDLTKLRLFRHSRFVDVRIPKFKVEMAIELNDLLKKLGMVDMFDPLKADFRGILDTNQQLHVSDIYHKASIEVNEDGAEVEASSCGCSSFDDDGHRFRIDDSDPEPIYDNRNLEFHANHPFVYYIWNKEIQAALFMGRITRFD